MDEVIKQPDAGGAESKCLEDAAREYGQENVYPLGGYMYLVKKNGKIYHIKKLNRTNPHTTHKIDITDFIKGGTVIKQ